MWFDNHCHLTSMKGDPQDAVDSALEAGVTRLLSVGVTVDDSVEAARVAAAFDNVWATAGVHPHEAKNGIDGLEALLHDPKIVAVGECGLDYHYDYSPRSDQADAFRRQIALAHRYDYALVIHTREAWDDTFAILDTEGVPPQTVFHCFTGGISEVEACLELGASISYSGIVTFKGAGDLRAAALITPLDRLLVETDSPYLAPVPHRGKPNVPAHVSLVGTALAQLLDLPPEEVATATTENAVALYGLPDSP